MNSPHKTIPISRYIALDLHKHYNMVGNQNRQQELVLLHRKVQISRLRDWAVKNLKADDSLILEANGNTWDIYAIVAPQVSRRLYL